VTDHHWGFEMSKKGSFIGGHKVLTQRPRDFDAELERAAIRAKKRATKAQAAFDVRGAKSLAKSLAKIDNLDQAMREAAADRRAETQPQEPDRIVGASKRDFVVVKVSRKR
jgi:hypothetical protein